MSEVLRFGFGLDGPVFRQCSDGCYVLISDFDRVTAERDAALNDAESLRESIRAQTLIINSIANARDAALQLAAALEGLSVTKILLDIVPGDGSGHEVYAKSVADVEEALSRAWRKVDAFEDQVSALKGALRDIRHGCDLSKLRDAQIDEILKP